MSRNFVAMFSTIVRFVAFVGRRIRLFLAEVGAYSVLLGRSAAAMRSLGRDRRLVLEQMEHIGTGSLPLVMIIGLFTGMVSAWQAAYQFKGLIPYSFLGAAVSRAILMGPGPV